MKAVIYPSIFKYNASGYIIFTELLDALKISDEIIESSLGRQKSERPEDPYRPDFERRIAQDNVQSLNGSWIPPPMDYSEINNLERAVVKVAKTFSGDNYAPTVFEEILDRISLAKEARLTIDRKNSLGDKIRQEVEEPTSAAHKLIDNDFLTYQIKEENRLFNLALKHRLIWTNGLNAIELILAKTVGTDFKCVICYEEFNLTPQAKKLWPKPCRDYPVCSEFCAISLEQRVKDSVNALNDELAVSVLIAKRDCAREIIEASEQIVRLLSITLEECADCQHDMVRVDIGAFEKFHSIYGTNIAAYEGRCHSCLGLFWPKKNRKRNFCEPVRHMKDRLLFKLLGTFHKWYAPIRWASKKFGMFLLLCAGATWIALKVLPAL